MNKDAIVATLIGFGVGLVITGLVLYGPALTKSIKLPTFSFKLPTISLSLPSFQKSTPTPTPNHNDTTPKEHAVTIESPLPDALEQEESILISGSTSKQATVLIASETEDSVIVANADGKYAGKITLAEGKNTIQVTSIDAQAKTVSQTVTVYYTPEKL